VCETLICAQAQHRRCSRWRARAQPMAVRHSCAGAAGLGSTAKKLRGTASEANPTPNPQKRIVCAEPFSPQAFMAALVASRRARERLGAALAERLGCPSRGGWVNKGYMAFGGDEATGARDDFGQGHLLWQRLGGVPSSPWRDSEAPHAEVAQACRVPLLSQRQGMLPYCGGFRHSPALQCRAARRTHACTLERQPRMDVNTSAARVDNLLHAPHAALMPAGCIGAPARDGCVPRWHRHRCCPSR
jgi:hypothetical protein